MPVFNLKPTLCTYLHLAYPCGIMENPVVPTAMLNGNIQWAFPKRKQRNDYLRFDFHPPLGLKHYAKLGLLRIAHFRMSAQEIQREDILNSKIMGILKTGGYVLLFVDYCYIEGAAQYMKRHFGHPWLIVEGNAQDCRYIGALYTKDGSFGFGAMSFGQLPAALLHGLTQRKRGKPEEKYSFVEIRNTDVKNPEKLNMADIKTQLRCYLHSSNSLDGEGGNPAINSVANKNARRCIHSALGLNAYETIGAYFSEKCKSRRVKPDLRVSRLLWEHKKLMKIRLKRMLQEGIHFPATLLAEWNEIERLAYWIHLKAFAATRRNDIVAMGSISCDLVKLKLMETDFICCLLKQL